MGVVIYRGWGGGGWDISTVGRRGWLPQLVGGGFLNVIFTGLQVTSTFQLGEQ